MVLIPSTKKLNIAIVLSHFELSGVTTNTIDLCEGLVNIGHKVSLIIGTPQEQHQLDKASYVKSKGVKVIEIPDLHRGALNRIRAFCALTLQLIRGKFDVIHLESIYLSIIPKLIHKKFTVTLHSWGLNKNFFSPRATRIIAISNGMKEEAINRHGYKEKDIDIVLHGVSPRFAQPFDKDTQESLRKQFGIPLNKKIVGIVGSIQPRKGHHFLLEAVNKLPPKDREQVHLVFCGNPIDSECEIWINEQIEKNALKDKVTRISHTDPLNVYRCLDIFCLPSVWEGFPLVSIEAMLTGNCVLRSNVQGSEEQIIEGVTGYTFKSENVEDLSDKIHFLISNPECIHKTGKESRNYAIKHFTLNTMAENTLKVYMKMLNSK